MALSRNGFFDQAEFHGGTALRILYKLQRFSEDLDFVLLKPNQNFSLTPYLEKITNELSAFGYEVEINDRSKANKTVKSAFLKDDSIGKVLTLQSHYPKKKIKIKLEMDTSTPLQATTEIKYLSFPSPFSILAKDLPSVFSGKLHALLCRNYIKGRDWYDFIWLVAQQTKINFDLLSNALDQTGPWENQKIQVTSSWLKTNLAAKINSIDWKKATSDVAPFIKSHEQAGLEIWGDDFFIDQLNKLKQ